jgi:hypothetical protein
VFPPGVPTPLTKTVYLENIFPYINFFILHLLYILFSAHIVPLLWASTLINELNMINIIIFFSPHKVGVTEFTEL